MAPLLYVLDPHKFSEEKFSKGIKHYIRITEIEPGSELAQAVVRLERQYEAPYGRLRQIAARLHVKLQLVEPDESEATPAKQPAERPRLTNG